jgi:hypothetical protein
MATQPPMSRLSRSTLPGVLSPNVRGEIANRDRDAQAHEPYEQAGTRNAMVQSWRPPTALRLKNSWIASRSIAGSSGNQAGRSR